VGNAGLMYKWDSWCEDLKNPGRMRIGVLHLSAFKNKELAYAYPVY